MRALCSPAFPCEKEHLWSVVSLDATQIHQVIVNPATTASHAIGSSPGTITINLASRVIGQDDHLLRPDIQEGLYVCLSVVDSGCGMDPATVQRIFDPFFTTKPIGQGTGLGLSVVHEIVSCYGGTITVYSEPGKGSCFRLYFPAIAGSAPVASTSTPAPTPISREHILYVDDEEGLVMLGTVLLQRHRPRRCLRCASRFPLATRLFRCHGHGPLHASYDRLRSCHSNSPALPGLSRPDDLWLRPPEDQRAAELLGIRRIITKPSTLDQLGEALAEAIHSRQAAATPSQ
jgi:hypothetical protein